MPILYALISRGTTILSKCKATGYSGNFREVTKLIISKIPLINHKRSFPYGDHCVHFICENHIIYLCITDDDFEQQRAFLFLDDIKQKFTPAYNLTLSSAGAYVINSNFSKVLLMQMVFYSHSREFDVRLQIEELKRLAQESCNSLKDRGEKLELLVNKTERLENTSVGFRQQSRNLARQMFWKKIRFYVVIGVVLVLVSYIVISISCGGLAWQKCIHNN